MRIEIDGASTLGALVYDLDLRQPSVLQIEELKALFLDRSVLVFKLAHLTQSEHIAFSRHWGRLERTLSKRTDRAEISLLGNVKQDGSIGPETDNLGLFLKGNRDWHSDSSFKPVSAKASILRAETVPSTGGDTEWADMSAAYDVLTAGRKRRLKDLVGVHSYEYSQGLVGGIKLLNPVERQALPSVQHPLVRTHPETKRKSLFLGRHIAGIEGMETADARELLADLTEHACQPPRLFRHSWEAGDIAIWDNRCVLHRGHPWPYQEPRVMQRTTIAGEGENPWALPEADLAATD